MANFGVGLLTYSLPEALVPPEDYVDIGFGAKMAMALVPNINIWMGSQIITIQEQNAVGLQWGNVGEKIYPTDDFTMAHVILMSIASSFIYFLITWYIDGVSPGKYGVPRKYYFPFQVRKEYFSRLWLYTYI